MMKKWGKLFNYVEYAIQIVIWKAGQGEGFTFFYIEFLHQPINNLVKNSPYNPLKKFMPESINWKNG